MQIPNIKALILTVSEKKNFEVGFLCSYVPTCDPRCGASFEPHEHHMNKLGRGTKTKYQSSTPSSFRRKEF